MAKKKRDDFVVDSDGDGDEEERTPAKKKAASGSSAAKQASKVSAGAAAADKDKLQPPVWLSETKGFTISEFKGQRYADIRVYYNIDGDDGPKPTKKGISLKKEELVKLKDAIDEMIAAL
ncbi:hypothetical protein HDU82_003253 [Entophlyctis luteolus]|nr:hypothetical protein HDU82_003253 [Entophlyctis luteolus]